MTRTDLTNAAKSWVGVPYVHQGRSRSIGVDCVGLLIKVCEEFGVPYQDQKSYAPSGVGIPNLKTELDRMFDPVYPHQAGPGDILAFWLRQPNFLQHCGIKTEKGFVHCHAGLHVVVEHGLNDFWAKRVGQAYRFKQLVDLEVR